MDVRSEKLSSPKCPVCGRLVAPGTAEGLCSRCVFRFLDSEWPGAGDVASIPGAGEGLKRLGDYDLVETIARGGMGVVFKARQRSLGRWVAVKVLSGGAFASPEFIKRFRTESDAVATLDHPNIVPIFEIGESDGQWFFSMKLLEGGTLGKATRDGPLSPAVAASLVAKIARSVHYAHQRGVLHRDIKPNNILFDTQGEPFLTDFGLARWLEGESDLTRTLELLGTPAYMSPEQARGKSRDVTTATDVYGLGAVLYELLTAQPPFLGETSIQTVHQVLDREPTRPSFVNRAVDRDLETICLKCLEKDPGRRYGSAEALAEDLERWKQQEPIRARPSTPLERFVKWTRRRPTIAALAATSLVGILAVFVVSSVMTWRLVGARREVSRQAEVNRRGIVRLFVMDATRSMEAGDYFGALLPLVEALRKDAGHPEGEETQRRRIGALLQLSPNLRQLWMHPGQVLHASLSSDGHRLAVATGDGLARVWDVESGLPVGAPLVHGSKVLQVVFNQNNRYLATQEEASFARLWDYEQGRQIAPPLPHRSSYYQPIVFPLGSNLVAIPGPDFVRVAQWSAPETPVTSLERSGVVQGLGASRDGRYLVCGGADHIARVWDIQGGQWMPFEMVHPAPIRAAFFTGLGNWIVTIATDRRVRLWDGRTGQLHRVMNPHQGDIIAWSVSPDGARVATAGFDNTARIWDVTNGGAALTVLTHPAGVDAVEYSPDGSRLATGSYDGLARVWSVESGRLIPPVLPHPLGVSVVLNEAGGRLITGSFRGDVRQWKLPENQGARAVLKLSASPVFVSFVSGGKSIVVVAEDGKIQGWKPELGHPSAWKVQQEGAASAGALSPDGRWVAVGGVHGEVTLWERGREQSQHRWNGHTNAVSWMQFSHHGRYLATASVDGSVCVWDVESGALVVPRLVQGYEVLRGDFSPDDRQLATCGMGGMVCVWELGGGTRKHEIRIDKAAVASVDFSPNGRRLITAHWDYSNDGKAAQSWDAGTARATGEPMLHRDGVRCARFSPDGRWIATGGEDNLARVWAAETGRPVTPFLRHRGFVDTVAFSADNRWLATGSRDGTARVWDATDGQPLTPALSHGGMVTHVEFSADGDRLLSASSEGVVWLWDLSRVDWPVDDLAKLAELLDSHRLEANGDRTPLTPDEISEAWTNLRKAHPDHWSELRR